MKSLIFIPKSSDELILIAEKEWERKQRQHQDKASWISGYLEGYFSKPVDLKQHDAVIAAKARDEGAKAERERVLKEKRIGVPLKDCKKCTLPCTQTGKEISLQTSCPEFIFGKQDPRRGDLIVRRSVKQFAVEMEKVLRENDYKGDWYGCTLEYLFTRLKTEVGEATEDFEDGDMKATSRELIDIANFCMMFNEIESLRSKDLQ